MLFLWGCAVQGKWLVVSRLSFVAGLFSDRASYQLILPDLKTFFIQQVSFAVGKLNFKIPA